MTKAGNGNHSVDTFVDESELFFIRERVIDQLIGYWHRRITGYALTRRTELARQHARDCAEMAHSTIDPHLQRSFLELEKQLLEHAAKAEERPLWRRVVAIVSAFGP